MLNIIHNFLVCAKCIQNAMLITVHFLFETSSYEFSYLFAFRRIEPRAFGLPNREEWLIFDLVLLGTTVGIVAMMAISIIAIAIIAIITIMGIIAIMAIIYKSRGVAYTGYHITSNAENGDEGERRESYLFHHTTRSLCASVAATLSQGPTGGYTCSHRGL